MLMVFKNFYSYIQYVCLSVKQNLIASFQNKKSFFVQTTFMALNNITWLIVWMILFEKSNNQINGVTIKDIMYLWSLPTISFGLTFMIFGGIEDISTNISRGNLDVYLCQPKYSLIGLLTSKCKVSAIGDLVYGLVIGIIATNFNIIDYIFLIILAIFSSLILTSIVSIVHIFSFWFGDISQLALIYTNSLLITLSIYPKEIFNTITKVLLYTVIPTYYCVHLPIEICTSFSFLKLFIFFGVLIFFIVLTIIIYEKGLKRYESGNGFNLK